MKITLRELFLIVALAAMGCGWWVDRSALSKRLDDFEAKAAFRAWADDLNAAVHAHR